MRRSERRETRPPAAAFIEGARHDHAPCEEGQEGGRATVAHSPGEKFEAPTPSDSRARRTRAFISQVKRPIQPAQDGTAVSTPHAPRLKRSALKSYVRAVPSRGRGARPPADQASQEGLRRAQFPVSPDPIKTPSKSCKAVFRRAQIPSRPTPALRNNFEKKKPFEVQNPQAMATYVPEVARLTCNTGSNSRLRMTERGMTEDEHNRGQGPSPIGSRRIFTSHIRDPCGCHVSGIPSREASSPWNLTNGSDIHRDCPRVLFEMCP